MTLSSCNKANAPYPIHKKKLRRRNALHLLKKMIVINLELVLFLDVGMPA